MTKKFSETEDFVLDRFEEITESVMGLFNVGCHGLKSYDEKKLTKSLKDISELGKTATVEFLVEIGGVSKITFFLNEDDGTRKILFGFYLDGKQVTLH